VVFGVVAEEIKSKRPMMGNIASQIADIVVITSDNPRLEDPVTIAQDIVCGVPEKSHHKMYKNLIAKRRLSLRTIFQINGSIIVLLGKGPDEYQIVGTTKHYLVNVKIVSTYNLRMRLIKNKTNHIY